MSFFLDPQTELWNLQTRSIINPNWLLTHVYSLLRVLHVQGVISLLGKAHKLRGRYLDVEHDIQQWVENADEIIEKDLHHMKVDYYGYTLPGLTATHAPANQNGSK